MMFRPIATLVLLTLTVAACTKKEAPAPTPTPAPAPSSESAAPPPATAPASGAKATRPRTSAPHDAQAPSTDETEQARSSQESSGEVTDEEHRDASLSPPAATPAAPALPDDRWKAGVNYQPLVPPQPTNTSAGEVEVIEMFAYGCPHCAALEPYMLSWLKTKPAYVKLEQVPAWGGDEAKLFYTIEALGKPELHQKVFEAIHPHPGERHYDLLFAPGNDSRTTELQRAFLVANGVSASDFDKARSSFSMANNLKRADALLRRYSELYEVGTVPSVVINGKYVTDVGRAGGHTQLLQLINDLAASESHH